jgi:hypothetical protein
VSVPAVPACRNCGAAAGSKYCPECGQETAPHPPSAREFLHEFVGHYVAVEGALWITLKKLMVPGALTLEYLAGRKRRYVHPLRLYLTASVVFFLVARFLVPAPEIHVVTVSTGPGHAPTITECKGDEAFCAGIRERMSKRFPGMNRAQFADYLVQRVVTLFPYAMFVLLPVFASLTRAVYRNRPYNYGEHLVFALHVHAFVFFVGALVAPLKEPILWTIPAAIYLSVAMRRVFGGRRLPSILRAVFVFLSYCTLLTATLIGIISATAFL